MIELYQGDCLKIMDGIESESIDAIIADPPYGTTACKWDSLIPFEPMWEQLKRIIKLNGAIVLFGSQPFTSVLICSNLGMFKYCLVWEKNGVTGVLNAKKQPLRNYEDVCIFYSSQPTYNPQGIKRISKESSTGNTGNGNSDCYGSVNIGKYTQTATNYPSQILKFSSESGKHPTQKPVPLMEYLIKTYTNESETVLDFTMGSGTTGVACKQTNRAFIGIEKDLEYFKIAQKRIKAAEHQLSF